MNRYAKLLLIGSAGAFVSSVHAEKLELDGQQALGLYATFQNARLRPQKKRTKKGIEERLSTEKITCSRHEDKIRCEGFTPTVSEDLYEILQESGIKETCEGTECRLTVAAAACTRTTASDDIQWNCILESSAD